MRSLYLTSISAGGPQFLKPIEPLDRRGFSEWPRVIIVFDSSAINTPELSKFLFAVHRV